MNRNEELCKSYVELAYQGHKITECSYLALARKNYEGYVSKMKKIHSEYMEFYNAFLLATKIKED